MGLITAVRDFSRKRKLAAELLAELQRARRRQPGSGIDISRRDDPEGVAALMYLVQHHPEVTVVKNKKGATLMFKRDVDRVFTPDIAHGPMARANLFAEPREDLFDDE